jgi:hypothetical protein
MKNITCHTCGVVFGLTDSVDAARREDHKTFYCPNGHSQYFPGKTEEEKLIEELRATLARERRQHSDYFHELIEDRDAERTLARTCPLCGERPAAKVRIHENVTLRMADHLRDEHGARQRLRSLPRGESDAA